MLPPRHITHSSSTKEMPLTEELWKGDIKKELAKKSMLSEVVSPLKRKNGQEQEELKRKGVKESPAGKEVKSKIMKELHDNYKGLQRQKHI